ncbi:hypothetical protein MTQ01_03160 [Streptomyces sp. XM4193]|uniref:hypothetical protein n=1 Tax=Streptomyces sp. XM4193 TaxID=2929782 RepID=UPI001FF7B031|nr:hypothetical protein [Streptomyces sp. XM4193]MCK1795031.1 hypothetical protein [Streptomyces sp. XM4193]
MTLNLNLAVLLAVVLVILLRRRVAPRKKADQYGVVFAALLFGILIAPTDLGQTVLSTVGQVLTVAEPGE